MADAINKMEMDLATIPFNMNTLGLLAPTPAVPARYQAKVNDLFAAVMVGREIGIPPMMAINELFLVDGKVSMSGKLMSHLVHRAGHQLRIKITAKGTTVEAWRRDPWTHKLDLMGEFSFTDADAKKAGLDRKATFESYPTMMRTWRAITFACRTVFADCLGGVGYVPEELDIEEEAGYTIEAIPVDEIEVIDDDTGNMDIEVATATVVEVMEVASVVDLAKPS